MPRQQRDAAGTNLTPEVLARALQRLVDEDTTDTTGTTGTTGTAAAVSTELTVRQPATVLRKETPRRAAISAHHDHIRAENTARRTPYLATTGTAAAGYLGWGLTELVGLAAGSGAELATTTGIGLASIGALAGARALLHDRIPAFWRRQSWAGSAGTAAWITTASAVGPANWTMTALLAGGAAATWASWMRHHSIPDVDPDAPHLPAASEEPTDSDYGDTLAQRWADNVSRSGKAVPGAMLTDRTDLTRAIRWTVRTPAGDVSFDDVFGRRNRIAAALGISAKNVMLEPHEDNEAWAYLTVIVRDLLSGGIPYTGPRYDHGAIPLGPFADGEGDMHFYAVEDIGVRNGLVTGEPGSGKSASLEAIGLGLKHSGVWHLLFGDGDPDGGSSPVLNDISDWAEAGPRQVLAQLEAVEAALEIRSLLKSTLTEGPDGTPVPITDPATQSPLRKLLPSTTVPGLMWIIDELQRLSTDTWLAAQEFIPRLERVVRIGRKYGVAVVVGTQSLLAGDYGNSTVLRGYLMARNLLAFRNKNRSENAVVGGMAVAPGSLPAGGGYCFAIAGGRLSMGRVAWAPDLGEWATALPQCPLDENTALAMRDFQPETEQSPSARFTAQVEKLHAWRRRKESGEPADAPDANDGPAAPLPGFMQGLQIPSALGAQNVVPLRPRPTSSPTPDSAQAAPDIEGLPASQREVLRALHTGHRRTGDIVGETGLKPPAVSKALGALSDLGLAHKIAHGQWEPIETESQTG
ncbi:hypothetical protein AD006_32620 (plasmid) [Pseudonocardia sp. EC080610-09]|uniref:hypothetical protein n=1 Tax=Pseudonocardia sp. EC080610-09 TaxID=1688404 RepID=UPI0007068D09|nr:hypothetical protein [Pseudonocardia sp. EC080610-09]ALL79962.1 hypothetical protein AD006_32620 [Pseudonocardia sp. EC080610-09]